MRNTLLNSQKSGQGTFGETSIFDTFRNPVSRSFAGNCKVTAVEVLSLVSSVSPNCEPLATLSTAVLFEASDDGFLAPSFSRTDTFWKGPGMNTSSSSIFIRLWGGSAPTAAQAWSGTKDMSLGHWLCV